MFLQAKVRAFLVRACQSAVTGDIGREYARKPSRQVVAVKASSRRSEDEDVSFIQPQIPPTASPRATLAPRRSLTLRELDRRHRPVPVMAADGNSQAVILVERDNFDRSRLSVAEDHDPADKFGLGLMERAEDR